MIFGNGMIATELKKSNYFDNFNIIVKGVSNSNENSEKEYIRQELEILKCIDEIKKKSDLKTVYISSILTGGENIYFQKKKEIEFLLKKNIDDLVIVRLTNVVGFNQNKANIFRYFQQQIKNGKCVRVNINAIRNIIDVQDVAEIIKLIVAGKFENYEYEIGFNENISALHLAKIIEKYYYNEQLVQEYPGDFSSNGIIDVNQYVKEYFEKKAVNLESYILNLLRKYESTGLDL